MKPQRSGTILCASSIAGVIGGLGPHVYATAKSAVIGLTRNVAAELCRFGIRVNCIVPGNMATEMIAGLTGSDPDVVEPIRQGLALVSPLPGRAGLPEDIAHAALFLASDEAGYVSGHTLVVDAGVTTGSAGKEPPFVDQHSPMIREAGRRGLPED
jgi:NAD(P)-dependent dehydrogenase (short-subunit alcohol dehydrogenase family)